MHCSLLDLNSEEHDTQTHEPNQYPAALIFKQSAGIFNENMSHDFELPFAPQHH